MEKRTFHLICLSKRKYDKYQSDDPLDRIITYMSNTCSCDKNFYSSGGLNRIMLTAFYDFIDCCDKPSYLLKRWEETERWNNLTNSEDILKISKIIIGIFSTTEVYNGEKYVNGFTEEMYNNINFNE